MFSSLFPFRLLAGVAAILLPLPPAKAGKDASAAPNVVVILSSFAVHVRGKERADDAKRLAAMLAKAKSDGTTRPA